MKMFSEFLNESKKTHELEEMNNVVLRPLSSEFQYIINDVDDNHFGFSDDIIAAWKRTMSHAVSEINRVLKVKNTVPIKIGRFDHWSVIGYSYKMLMPDILDISNLLNDSRWKIMEHYPEIGKAKMIEFDNHIVGINCEYRDKDDNTTVTFAGTYADPEWFAANMDGEKMIALLKKKLNREAMDKCIRTGWSNEWLAHHRGAVKMTKYDL